ncbi:hypothetical protein T07_10033 [Trichinella nelsoni]|uniref:Uncharacterized protein n=1 Tax=Trichinella nelsoni TaxID=6336 RepID=A0A0V0RBN9_9BILA|nr:hypothetical protein T07_10033 [Trichinella nelsoni]
MQFLEIKRIGRFGTTRSRFSLIGREVFVVLVFLV